MGKNIECGLITRHIQLNYLDAYASAIVEDALGICTPVDQEFRLELQRCESEKRIPDSTGFKWASDLVYRFLPRTRVLSNDRIDSIATHLDAPAFCFANNIFVHSDLVTQSPDRIACALIHEIAHLKMYVDDSSVRCWNRTSHAKLSVYALSIFENEFRELFARKSIDASMEEFCNQIKRSSNRRDYVGRFHHRTIPYLLGGWIPYVVFRNVPVLGPALRTVSDSSDWMWTRGVKYIPISKGEGPRHGEGANYIDVDGERNVRLNLKQEEHEISRAVRALDARPNGKIFADLVGIVGDLLHVTQDRAAHREGRRGFGHDDPRCATGWSPDNPDLHDHPINRSENPRSWWLCNHAAYRRAQNNSCDAMERFLTTLDVNIVSAWNRQPESCGDDA